jgi:hypothetical protein
MNPRDRAALIGRIASQMQVEHVTSEINLILPGYGIRGADLPSVKSKRIYVQDLLADADESVLLQIARDYRVLKPDLGPTSDKLRTFLGDQSLESCRGDFERALAAVDKDPDQALGSACAFLESVCKSILDDIPLAYPKNQSITDLVGATAKALALSPDQYADAQIKRVLGGLANVAAGIGVIRTKFSAAHGRGKANPRLWSRHARLSVSAASAVALFLLETRIEMKSRAQ